MSHYFCKNQRRRADVRDVQNPDGSPRLNGIDFLEVLSDDQTVLGLHLIHPVPLLPDESSLLAAENFVITGGTRIQAIRVMQVERDDENPKALRLTVSQPGDFSTYRLQIVRSSVDARLPIGFEPPLDAPLAALEFSFKVNCPSEFDCPQPPPCPPAPLPAPQIDYLAKDYASFRQLMLDRLAVTLPDWQERNPADIGVVLVEMLAYAADQLSYYQDAVATEAYLGTARQRTSVRRHGRSLGYTLHEGCNARAWVQVQTSGIMQLAAGTPFLTRIAGMPGAIAPTSQPYREALARGATVFEALHDQRLFASHNEMQFYTWSDNNCCLPAGSTQATLRHNLTSRLHLRPGDVLMLEEKLSPETGRAADAELTHRHPVRLRRVAMQVSLTAEAIAQLQSNGVASDIITALQTIQDATFDHDGDLLQRVQSLIGEAQTAAIETRLLTAAEPLLRDRLTDQRVVEIAWYAEDALPFSLCLSKTMDGALTVDMAIASGNLVLADHGQTQIDLPSAPSLMPAAVDNPTRYRPRLPVSDLTHAIAFDAQAALTRAATTVTQLDPRQALPAISLTRGNEQWEARLDLLNSDRFDRGFVVEMEGTGTDRFARLRFGDNIFGLRPPLGAQFLATYRAGNGHLGNVGAEAIAHLVMPGESSALADAVLTVRNPLPAAGGIDPEPMQTAKLNAPQAFRVQQRAVTEADYAEAAARHPEVQKVRATRRWTGSWHTWFLTVDRKGGRPVDEAFEQDLRIFLERFRLAGYDLEIDAPRFVPLDIVFSVCVQPGYYASDVKAALLNAFSDRNQSNSRGFFHPDNFTFGQSVYLSRFIAAAMQVPGVQWVDSDRHNPQHRFQRWGRATNHELENGEIPMGRLEIARLDNNPNAPENGRIDFFMEGGQ
jgi:hypothetical protein